MHNIYFPDMTDLPAIPETWRDISWHNDLCPSFEFMSDESKGVCRYARVWIDYPDPAMRDLPYMPRFQITYESDNCDWHSALVTDDWQEIIAYVTARQSLAAEYVRVIGYNPFLDDPTIDPETVRQTLQGVA